MSNTTVLINNCSKDLSLLSGFVPVSVPLAYEILHGWFAKYEDKYISSWRELVRGNGQHRPITYKYTPGSSSSGTPPFKSSNARQH